MCFNPTRGFQRINGYRSFRCLHWSHGTLARRGQADSWHKQQYHLQYLLMMRIAPTAKMCTVRRGEKPYCVQFNLWHLGGKMYLLEVCLHWNHEGWEQEVSARRETPYGKQTLPFYPPGSRSLQGSCQSSHSTGTWVMSWRRLPSGGQSNQNAWTSTTNTPAEAATQENNSAVSKSQ